MKESVVKMKKREDLRGREKKRKKEKPRPNAKRKKRAGRPPSTKILQMNQKTRKRVQGRNLKSLRRRRIGIVHLSQTVTMRR